MESQLTIGIPKPTLIQGNSYTSQMDEMASIRSELIEVVQRVQTVRKWVRIGKGQNEIMR